MIAGLDIHASIKQQASRKAILANYRLMQRRFLCIIGCLNIRSSIQQQRDEFLPANENRSTVQRSATICVHYLNARTPVQQQVDNVFNLTE